MEWWNCGRGRTIKDHGHTAGSLEWRVFLDHPYSYQPQIVAENYFIVSKGWMRRELERY